MQHFWKSCMRHLGTLFVAMILFNGCERKELVKSWTTNMGIARSLAFSPDGKILAIGDTEGSLKLFSAGQWKQEVEIDTYQNTGKMKMPVFSMAFSSDGSKIAYSGRGVEIWQLNPLKRVTRITLKGPMVRHLMWGKSDNILVMGRANNNIEIWDIPNNDYLRVLEGHKDQVMTVSISPDNSLIASGSKDNTARIWSLENGEVKSELIGHQMQIVYVGFVNKGKELATVGSDGYIRVWDVSNGMELRKIRGDIGAIANAALSYDGNTLAVSGGMGKTLILDTNTWEAINILNTEEVEEGVALNAGGNILATGSSGGPVGPEIRIWSTGR